MVYNIKPLSVCWDLLPAGQALGKIPQRLFYVLIILRPALRFLIKPLPPLLFFGAIFCGRHSSAPAFFCHDVFLLVG